VLLSKHLYKQEWESVFIKLQFRIDPMSRPISVSQQVVPPHFTTKLRPWVQQSHAAKHLTTVTWSEHLKILFFSLLMLLRTVAARGEIGREGYEISSLVEHMGLSPWLLKQSSSYQTRNFQLSLLIHRKHSL